MSTRAFVPQDEVTASDRPGGPSRLPDRPGRLAVFDLDRTLLPGSSLSLFGRALHRAGMVGGRCLAGYLAREAVVVRRGEGVSSAHRLLAALLADVADREAGPLLHVAEGLGEDLARTARPGARWLLDRHLAAGDFCVIVSASPQPLVDAAARAFGASDRDRPHTPIRCPTCRCSWRSAARWRSTRTGACATRPGCRAGRSSPSETSVSIAPVTQ